MPFNLAPFQSCLTTLPYRGNLPHWNSKCLAIKHILYLLKDINQPVDLTTVEELNTSRHYQRVLLSFGSPIFPSMFLAQKSDLLKGIISTRVFVNTVITALLPKLHQTVSQKVATSPNMEGLDTGLQPQHHWGEESDLITLDEISVCHLSAAVGLLHIQENQFKGWWIPQDTYRSLRGQGLVLLQ